MTEFWHALSGTVIQASPWLLLGFGLSGVLHEIFEARPRLLDPLTRPGARSVFTATAIGLPMPLCSCSVLPTALTLRRKGAGRGATASFLITVPETDLVSVGMTWALFGPVMAVARPVASLLTGLTTGLAVDAVAPETEPEPEPAPSPASGGLAMATPAEAAGCCCTPDPIVAPPPFWRRALHYGFVKFFDDIAPTLFAGLLVGAALTAVFPLIDTNAITGSAVATYGLMLILGVPMYVCATSSTPVAAGLVAGGVSPGAALVFLLAGPATNSASLLLLRRELGNRAFLVYIGGIVVLSLAAGMALDLWFGDRILDLAAFTGHHHEENGFLGVAAAVVFSLLLLNAIRRTKFRRS